MKKINIEKSIFKTAEIFIHDEKRFLGYAERLKSLNMELYKIAMGLFYFERGEDDEAYEYLKNVKEEVAEQYKIHEFFETIGKIENEKGKYLASGKHYAKAYEISNDIDDAENAISAFLLAKSLDRAYELTKKLFEERDYYDANFLRDAVWVFVGVKDFESAEKIFPMLKSIVDEDEYLNFLAYYILSSKKFNSPLRSELEVLFYGKHRSAALNLFGEILMEEKRYKDASLIFDRAGRSEDETTSLIPELKSAIFAKAVKAMVLAGDKEKAKEYVERLFASMPWLDREAIEKELEAKNDSKKPKDS